MKRFSIVIFILIIFFAGFFSYFFIFRYIPVRNILDSYKKENSMLVSELNKMKSTLPKKEKKVEVMGSLKEQISDFLGDVNVNEVQNKLEITLPAQKLFPPGSVEISKEGRDLLKQLGNILKGIEGKVIYIEGHSDNAKITGSLKRKYPTNWELSAARAVKVVRFLIEEVGVPPEKLAAVAYSEYRPIADNSTSEGRAKNRRIVVTLVPR